MDYQVRKLKNQGVFDVYVARDEKSEFMYWGKNTTQNVNQVAVVFDKKNANIQLNEGMMVLSLDKITNFADLEKASRFFMANINDGYNRNVKLYFVVENDKQKQVAEALGNILGVSCEIVKSYSYNKAVIADVENKLRNQNYVANGDTKTLEVQNGNSINKITVSDNKAYVNSGMLSIEEQKYSLLQEWKRDPYKSEKMSTMSEVEIDRMLTEAVTSNLKEYRMESAREQEATDMVGEVAMNKAIQEDGKVNAELGVVENNVSNVNDYSVVEEKEDGVQIVNPTVTSSYIDSGGISSSSVGTNNFVDSNLEENAEQSREVVADEFYLDEEYNVYNNNGEIIGKIGREGLLIDYNSNTLVRNGQVLGFIGDYKDMGKSNSNGMKKPNVRTLRKNDSNKSAAFVSFSVILFVLSSLLLMGSVILLFVLD